ncbi:MAG: DEAD/DEAH box helicase [Terriglobia bacterium]
MLAQARWRSPLLVMDEAHHLKNPGTALARQLQPHELSQDLQTGDGAMAKVFDRMLFLTATPFQLGHHELVNVVRRFSDVRWEASELGDRDSFNQLLLDLGKCLDQSQRSAIALQRNWSRLRPEDIDDDIATWWNRIVKSDGDQLTHNQKAVVDCFRVAKRCREESEKALRPWIVRHNKGTHWLGTAIVRRDRLDGAAISGAETSGGLPIPPDQLLPFFLAARSAVRPGKDLLGEALSSSYEAFRLTRQDRKALKDEQEVLSETIPDLTHAGWYLSEFDRALERRSGSAHPKINATVRKVVELWEAGEKVLVFAFYRHTCRSLRIHISREIDRHVMLVGMRKLHAGGQRGGRKEAKQLLERVQNRYFDVTDSPGRKALDAALNEIIQARAKQLDGAEVTVEQRSKLMDVMRRFLRVPTTLVRCFPLGKLDVVAPVDAVRKTLDHVDSSGVSWRHKFDHFIEFLTDQCSTEERRLYLEAALGTQTGGIRGDGEDDDDTDTDDGKVTLANVREATGKTRRDTRARLMRAFNTPFFPDILVCSQVMGEGVDLQRFCRHVIHHDLDWNPSNIEQRTGRVDRIGCKAEGRRPIVVYLPYLAGTADERQFRVMTEREQWFRVVMGQEEVAKLIIPESECSVPLPDNISEQLSFKLDLSAPRL